MKSVSSSVVGMQYNLLCLNYTADVSLLILNYAERSKKALMPCANSGGRDERVHPCSLIWTFSVRRHILQYQLQYRTKPPLCRSATTASSVSSPATSSLAHRHKAFCILAYVCLL